VGRLDGLEADFAQYLLDDIPDAPQIFYD